METLTTYQDVTVDRQGINNFLIKVPPGDNLTRQTIFELGLLKAAEETLQRNDKYFVLHWATVSRYRYRGAISGVSGPTSYNFGISSYRSLEEITLDPKVFKRYDALRVSRELSSMHKKAA